MDYNIDLLIEAVGLLRNKGVESFLTLAGDGPERTRLTTLTHKLGLNDRIFFAGFVPNDDLPSLLAQQDLYVSLIESDGVSASLLEAMATGLLPIVPDHPANRFWIKPGTNGLLLDNTSPTSVAAAVAKAILDLPLRQYAWEHNPETVSKRADLQRNSEIFLDRFRELAGNYHN
jgi:glycosyltransferase involved in cell wall biosynthesis